MARWLLLAAAGVAAGAFLGNMAVKRDAGYAAGTASYSGLSANPDALTPAAFPQKPCEYCPDSYGVAARLRAAREERMGDAFRELGTVDADMSPTSEPVDDYRYGGRFPDPAPLAPENITPANNPVREAADPSVPEDPQP